jgi:hypothetical protein
LAFDAHSGQHLVFDKTKKGCGHVESVDGNAVGHGSLFSKNKNNLQINLTLFDVSGFTN